MKKYFGHKQFYLRAATNQSEDRNLSRTETKMTIQYTKYVVKNESGNCRLLN